MGVTRVRNGRRRVVQHAEPANGSKPHSLSHPLSSVEVTPFHPPHTQQPQALTYPSKCQSFGTSPTPHPLLAPPPASRETREDRENGNYVTRARQKKTRKDDASVKEPHVLPRRPTTAQRTTRNPLADPVARRGKRRGGRCEQGCSSLARVFSVSRTSGTARFVRCFCLNQGDMGGGCE